MNRRQQTIYRRDLWPQVCHAQGWETKDEERRRACTRYATGKDSTAHLEEHEITALFTYLRHLADPDNAHKAALWRKCERDPLAYNRLNQGEHWRRKAGYQRTGRVARERFGVHFNEELDDHEISSREASNYLMTMRARAKGIKSAPAAVRRAKKLAKIEEPF